MEKLKLSSKIIPWGYERCFNENCQLRDQCLHYQAYLLQSEERLFGPAIYPDAWKDGQCRRFSDAQPQLMAWGFTNLFDNVPPYMRASARRNVHAYVGSGMKVYYQYHHGERLLTPRQQQDILDILARFGSTDGLSFDHYVTDFDFS